MSDRWNWLNIPREPTVRKGSPITTNRSRFSRNISSNRGTYRSNMPNLMDTAKYKYVVDTSEKP